MRDERTLYFMSVSLAVATRPTPFGLEFGTLM
jgi:hypothetical protein